MAQYGTHVDNGTIDLTNGSAVVAGNLTRFVTEGVAAGAILVKVGEGVPYRVGSVDGETQLTLTSAYAGPTAGQAAFVVHMDFTPNIALPRLRRGDREAPAIVDEMAVLLDGWTVSSGGEWRELGDAPLWVDGDTVKLDGDRRSAYHAGRRVRLDDGGGFKYATIVASGFAAGQTTLDLLNDGAALTDSLAAIAVGVVSIADGSLPLAAAAYPGLMAPADKSKLDGIEAGAEVTDFAAVQAALAAATGSIDFNGQELANFGLAAALPLAEGGTGAAGPAGARANLGAAAVSGDTFTGDVAVSRGGVRGTLDVGSDLSAANAEVGALRLTGEDAAGGGTIYGQIAAEIVDETDGSESGRLKLFAARNNTLPVGIELNDQDVVIDPGAAGLGFKLGGTEIATRGANSFVGDQSISRTGTDVRLQLKSDVAAASSRATRMQFFGHDDAGNNTEYARFETFIDDPGDGAEGGHTNFYTMQGGSLAVRFAMKAGFYAASASGLDQGEGTVNAVGVYDDGSLLTCVPLEYVAGGRRLDLAEWDALAPAGRRHEGARAFKALVDRGFDPASAASFKAFLEADGAVPGLVTRAEWAARMQVPEGETPRKFSVGEGQQRTWLAIDHLALAVTDLHDRLAAAGL